MRSVGIRSSIDTPDKVFVPHYEGYTQRFPGHGGGTKPPTSPPALCYQSPNCSDSCRGALEKGTLVRSGLPPPSPLSGLQGVLQPGHAQTHPPWAAISALNGSSVVANVSATQRAPQYQQSWIGMYRKLSECQVALRASEK